MLLQEETAAIYYSRHHSTQKLSIEQLENPFFCKMPNTWRARKARRGAEKRKEKEKEKSKS